MLLLNGSMLVPLNQLQRFDMTDHFTLGPGWMRMKPRPMDHAARVAEAHMWALRTWPPQVQSYEVDIREW